MEGNPVKVAAINRKWMSKAREYFILEILPLSDVSIAAIINLHFNNAFSAHPVSVDHSVYGSGK
jgi:hypothetical protein